MRDATQNDRLNLIIIVGLLSLDALLIGLAALIYLRSGQAPAELLLLIGGIPTGLLGFLSKELRQPPAAVAATGTVEQVTVESPAVRVVGAHDDQRD